MDINKVWLSGLVVSSPILTRLQSKTPQSSFTLQVNEEFKDSVGDKKQKPNLIQIESLGKRAEITLDTIKQGGRFMVDGYLRRDMIEGVEKMRVRSFAIYPDDSQDTFKYKEGIQQALEILKRSRDIPSAIKMLEDLAKT